MGRFRWHRVKVVVRGTQNATIKRKPLKYEGTEEFTETPQYPEILDTSYPARKKRQTVAWHESVKSIKTVEEKLMKINMPKYYGWRSVILKDDYIPYNYLPFAQHITRTRLLDLKTSLPVPIYHENQNNILERIKPQVEEALVFEYKYRSRKHQFESHEESPVTVCDIDNVMGKSVAQQINRILLTNLSEEAPHLLNSQIDADPRVESFWLAGWERAPERKLKTFEKIYALKHAIGEPFNRWIQYFGSPSLHLRHELPLPAISDWKKPELTEKSGTENIESAESEVPNFKYNPGVLGLPHERRVGTNIPGFWPGDSSEFGFLSFHTRGHLLNWPQDYGEEDKAEALHAKAILASYGWLLPQACYQGFSTYNDVTYPFVTQTVITNGKLWSFYVYQLNTTLVHTDNIFNNPRHNLCWGTPELKLFEEIVDGKVVGLNDEVLKILISFYLNKPQEREGIELKPYLGEDEKHVADIVDEKRRDWLEGAFKYMYSGRPRHRLAPEVYHWEHIYKIKHKTRPMDARRRHFELNIYPYNRRYNEHTPRYIPKKLREEGKQKQKFEDTYYP